MANIEVWTPEELQAACAHVMAGDTILVHSGRYHTRSHLLRKHGTPQAWITIRPADAGWISGGWAPDPFWGGGDPAQDSPPKPGDTDFAFLAIDKCSFVHVEGLRVAECWPTIFFVKNSRNVKIVNCTLRHGTYAIFAKENASHLLIAGNEWQQDDSPDHRLWSKIDWRRSHGNEGSDGLFRYFNGGFLSSKGILGNVAVHRNRISDAYNGVRLKVDAAPATGQPRTINHNVHVVENDFVRIRDNPIEPEVWAYDWHVRHNRLVDCHGWFSFDGVAGGYWYFYGNTGWFEGRQGRPGEEGHTMGRVLKLSYEAVPRDPETEDTPNFPWYVFNNSWHLRCPLIGGANPVLPPRGEGPDFTTNLAFFNNAFAWCDQRLYGAWVCEPMDMVHNFDWARSKGTLFDYTICNRPDYLAYFRMLGSGERNALLATRPMFVHPESGDFAPEAGSEVLGTAWQRDVESTGPVSRASLRARTLNRGAVQEYGLASVPDLEAKFDRLLAEIDGDA